MNSRTSKIDPSYHPYNPLFEMQTTRIWCASNSKHPLPSPATQYCQKRNPPTIPFRFAYEARSRYILETNIVHIPLSRKYENTKLLVSTLPQKTSKHTGLKTISQNLQYQFSKYIRLTSNMKQIIGIIIKHLNKIFKHSSFIWALFWHPIKNDSWTENIYLLQMIMSCQFSIFQRRCIYVYIYKNNINLLICSLLGTILRLRFLLKDFPGLDCVLIFR